MALLHAPRVARRCGDVAALVRHINSLDSYIGTRSSMHSRGSISQSETASSLLQMRRALSDRARAPCAAAEAAPCAPCARAPRPPCRRPAPPAARGVRVTCCAPPRGARPPCAPPAAPCARSCAHAAAQAKLAPNSCSAPSRCGDQLDWVARRLAAADSARRELYEREVAARRPPPAPARAPYRLHDERECLRATDGQHYAVSPAARCGSDRAPPPPRAVHVEPFDRCELRRAAHLDPCGHRPRIFLDIDRTTAPSPAAPTTNVPAERPPPPAGLTTRIMETLRRSAPASCPRRPCAPPRAPDAGRCARSASPASVPPPCTAPSVTERLRRRPRSEGARPCDSRREFHTSTARRGLGGPSSRPDTSQSIDVKSSESTLEAILRARERLEEAGRGRVVAAEGATSEARGVGAGGLELKIPPSAEAIRVRVSLDFTAAQASCLPAPCLPGPAPSALDSRSASTFCSSDSWLSIKNIQKKLSGGRSSAQAPPTPPCPAPAPCSQKEHHPELKNKKRETELKRTNSPCAPPPPRQHPASSARAPHATRAGGGPCGAGAGGGAPIQNKPKFSSVQDLIIPANLS
ncbi:atherin-like [Maniola jurtina]|uniref:atherin-like n=1 Tax=Maniola jurtina TaxID=191418 RepID=UPI001E689EF4|nr:atherin-like [Maniola jurtina]